MKKFAKKIQGVALIDLMIASAIGLFLLAGVSQVYLNSKSAYNKVSAYSQIQENSRFIQDYMIRIIRQSGYRTPPGVNSTFNSVTNVFDTAPYISGTHPTNPAGPDTLSISFQGNDDNTIVDCLNNPVPANTISTSTFSISDENLVCDNGAGPQVIVSGVEYMEVLYGEDLTGDYSANRYVNANYPPTWENVVSIRISLLLKSQNPVSSTSAQNTYYLLGTSYTPATADFHVRNQMTFTVVLRNVIVNPT